MLKYDIFCCVSLFVKDLIWNHVVLHRQVHHLASEDQAVVLLVEVSFHQKDYYQVCHQYYPCHFSSMTDRPLAYISGANPVCITMESFNVCVFGQAIRIGGYFVMSEM